MTPKPPTESVIETPPQVKPVVVVPKSLIFPSGISSLLAQEMEKRLAGIEVSNSQALIDELAGRMKVEVIKNPVGYLSALLKKFLSGDFYPELGIQVKKNRGILKNREALEKEADRKMQSVGQVDKSEPTKEFKQILAEMKRKTWNLFQINPIKLEKYLKVSAVIGLNRVFLELSRVSPWRTQEENHHDPPRTWKPGAHIRGQQTVQQSSKPNKYGKATPA